MTVGSRRELAERVAALEAAVAELRELVAKGAAKPRTPSGGKSKTD